jgi:hypothetical protein
VQAGLRDDVGTSMNIREQVSQASLVALLGGLRSLAAAIWDLWANSAWEKTNYGEVERNYLLSQRLQPRTFYYYDRGQWMMAYNAAHFYELQNQERGELNAVLRSAYTDKGMAMLRTGQRFLPHEPRLHEQEAVLYRDKIRPRQPEKEAAAWARTAVSPGAPTYARRMQSYALARSPGREVEAEALVRDILAEWKAQRKNAPPPTLLNLVRISNFGRSTTARRRAGFRCCIPPCARSNPAWTFPCQSAPRNPDWRRSSGRRDGGRAGPLGPKVGRDLRACRR